MKFEHYYSEKPTQDGFPIHLHKNIFEWYFCINGKGEYFVEGHRYVLEPGTTMLIRPGELHYPEIDTEHVYERCFVYFSEEMAKSIDEKLLHPFTGRPFGHGNYIGPDKIDTSLIKSCIAKMDENTDSSLGMQCYFYPVLYETYRAFSAAEESLPRVDALIAEIMEYINQNLHEDLSLDNIEKRFYINKTSLNQRFKKVTGKTIGSYILDHRLMQAIHLLRAGEAAVKTAHICGFADYSSFYRAFIKKFKISPGKITPE